MFVFPVCVCVSVGTSTICAVNRLGIYILLSILTNLCMLTYQLASATAGGTSQKDNVAMKVLPVVVPIVLALVGYALEVGVGEGENAQLNTARHAFLCSMRYAPRAR